MRDGINIARRGVPAVALVTEDFWPQGDFIANSLGIGTMGYSPMGQPFSPSPYAELWAFQTEQTADLQEAS